MKSTKNYGVWDNVYFMFRIAWTTRKSVIWICGILAILNVSITIRNRWTSLEQTVRLPKIKKAKWESSQLYPEGCLPCSPV